MRARIPGAVTYIGPEELERLDYDDVTRILRTAPGVNIQEEDGYGLRPNVGLRGTGLDRSSKITLMEDGILIAPAPYAAPSAYYFPHTGRMDAVEVRKGSSAIKFGPYTVGGALNLISTPVPDSWSGRVEALFGEHAERRIHAFAGGRTAHVGLLGETFQHRSDGFKVLDNGGGTGFDIEDYVAKIELTTGEKARIRQTLAFKFQYSDEVSDETYLGLTDADFALTPFRRYAGSQRDELNAEHKTYQLSHRVQFTPNIDLTTVLYRTDFHRNWYKLEQVNNGLGGPNRSLLSVIRDPATFAAELAILKGATSGDNALVVRNNNRTYYAEGVQSVAGFGFATGAMAHQMEIGGRFHRDEEDRFQWNDRYRMDNGTMVLTTAGIPGTQDNRIGGARAFAFFVQDEITLGRFRFVPGVRYEHIKLKRENFGTADVNRTGANLAVSENTVDVVIPGLGVTFDATGSLQLLAGVHKGFAPPGPGSSSKEEEAINYEAGLRYEPGAVFAEAIGFFSDYSNLIGFCTNSTGGGCTIGDQFNAGAVDAYGVELALDTDLARLVDLGKLAVPLKLAYTFTKAEFQNSFQSDFEPWGTVVAGDEVPLIPPHQVFFGAGIEYGPFHANTVVSYVAETRNTAGQGPIPTTDAIDSHVVVDLAASYEILKGVRLVGKLDNVFDAVYSVARTPAGLRPGKPRTFSGGLRVAF